MEEIKSKFGTKGKVPSDSKCPHKLWREDSTGTGAKEEVTGLRRIKGTVEGEEKWSSASAVEL